MSRSSRSYSATWKRAFPDLCPAFPPRAANANTASASLWLLIIQLLFHCQLLFPPERLKSRGGATAVLLLPIRRLGVLLPLGLPLLGLEAATSGWVAASSFAAVNTAMEIGLVPRFPPFACVLLRLLCHVKNRGSAVVAAASQLVPQEEKRGFAAIATVTSRRTSC